MKRHLAYVLMFAAVVCAGCAAMEDLGTWVTSEEAAQQATEIGEAVATGNWTKAVLGSGAVLLTIVSILAGKKIMRPKKEC